MSSAKIDITVENEGEAIGYRENSPVRKMPDGTAGVVISGLVYPIYADHSVDLADEGISKTECPEFFRPGEELVYASFGESDLVWAFEQSRRGSYLAFDGDEAFAERLNQAFEAEGFSRGYGESFRPAKDGYFYDYFIRILPHVDESDVRRVIDEVDASEPAAVASGVLDALRKVIAAQQGVTNETSHTEPAHLTTLHELQEEVGQLREAVQSKQQELERIASELEIEQAARQRLAFEAAALRAENTKFQNDLKSAREALGASDFSWDDLKAQEIDELSEKNRRLEEGVVNIQIERDRVSDENERLLAEIAKERELRAKAEEQLENLALEQRPTKALTLDRPVRSKREKQILHDLITGAFPRLELDDRDFANIISDFNDISACARVLSDLQEKRDIHGVKPFKGTHGLFEVPGIRTGKKDAERMGRIYYRRLNGEDRLEVGVHVKRDKKDQENFVRGRFV